MLRFSQKASLLALLLTAPAIARAEGDRDSQVRKDREALRESDIWVYNDLPAAMSAAAKSKKPILLVFR